MAGYSLYDQKGELRLYSPATTSTGGATPDKFLKVYFQNSDFRFPFGTPVPAEQLILDANQYTSDAHRIEGDELEAFAPQPLTYTIRGIDKYLPRILAAHSNVENLSTWTVGNFIWTGQTSTQITRLDGGGTSRDMPPFTSTRYRFVRVEYKLDKTSTDSGVADQVHKFTGVFFPPDQLTAQMAVNNMTISVNGQMFGSYTRATAFSTGAQTDT